MRILAIGADAVQCSSKMGMALNTHWNKTKTVSMRVRLRCLVSMLHGKVIMKYMDLGRQN